MAVDSHEDNQYELAIDTVNNNSKHTENDSFLIDDSDLSFYSISSDSPKARTCGSAKRKCTFVSKGISIKEFLTVQDTRQLTAIDKLLEKNKAALVQNQMKQPRVKGVKNTCNGKKETVKPAKVLGSKIAAKRKLDTENKKNTKQSKPKNVKVTPQIEKPKEKKTPVKVVSKSKTLTEKSGSTKKILANTVNAKKSSLEKNSCKKPSTKKDEEIKKNQESKIKPIVKSQKVRKVEKLERKPDFRNFQPNPYLKTRSSAKVQLRNGKSRIIQESKSENTLHTPRKYRKSIADESLELVNGKIPSLKRLIKQEPQDECVEIPCKKRKIEIVEPVPISKADEPVTKERIAVDHVESKKCENEKLGFEISDVRSIKDEFEKPIKKEAKEPELINTVEEINVVNKNLINTDNISRYVLQDLGSYVKEIERNSPKTEIAKNCDEIVSVPNTQNEIKIIEDGIERKSGSAPKAKDEVEIIEDIAESEEEFSLLDLNTESEDVIDEEINLQYESDDNFIEECDILEKSIQLAQQTKVSETPKVESQPTTKENIESGEPVEQISTIPETSSEQKIVEKEPAKENKSVKESILGALGLQSLEKVYQKSKEKDNYTGTLKAVIKIDKGCRRMEMKQSESYAINLEGLQNENVLSFYSKIQTNNRLEDSTECADAKVEKPVGMENNGLNGNAKTLDEKLLTSLREADGGFETDYNVVDQATEKNKATTSLVVPEKSSSFSIHPNRLCYDVCKYCFGKFGSLDTPCHVGQMKNPERRRKILLCEPNLKPDTCLCDACYRYVDRKANKPPQRNKNKRRSMSLNQRIVCAIQDCEQFARHTVKRKCLLRLSKKIGKLSFDVNKRGRGMSYGLCSQHYYLVDFYTLCGICKKRLNRNHMYSIRSELNDMNEILRVDSIPIKLVDNMLLCRLCHYYMMLRLKYGDSSKMTPGNRQYYKNFRKKVLLYYNVMVSDSEDTISSEGLKSENGHVSSPERTKLKIEKITEKESNEKRNSKNNQNVGIQDIANLLKPLEGDGDKNSARIQVKFGNLNIGKLSNLNIGQNTQAEVKHDKSNEKELPLVADFRFENAQESQKNWEKCVSTILFDKGTKKLWQDLQQPYGNQSSFIRHLIMLEKYWRAGCLVLSDNADQSAVKYINSVKNRVESFPSPITPPTLTPIVTQTPKLPPLQPTFIPNSTPVQAESSVMKHIPAPPPLLKIDQLNSMQFNVRKTSEPPKISPMPPKLVYQSHENISLGPFADVQSQPRVKKLTQLPNSNKALGVSLLKKPVATAKSPVSPSTKNKSYSNGLPNKTYPSLNVKRPSNVEHPTTSSLLIAKLPKTLTVTQIAEKYQEKLEEKPLIPNQFLVGEKPSITVFREMS